MMLPRSIRPIALLLLFLLVVCPFARGQEAPLNGFDDYVQKAMRDWQIEGAPTGFFVQFEMAEGKPKSLTLIQGSGPSLVLLPKQ